MSDPHDAPVFELVRVSKIYAHAGGVTHALREVSFEGRTGELIVLLGPSGSGKTTLLTVLAGLVHPTDGEVRLFGREVDGCDAGALQRLRAARIGFVFQSFHLFDVLRVVENVMLVQRFNRVPRLAAHARAMELLTMLGLGPLARKFPDQLSQGERQRVAIARALANRPALLLADEPTASLESRQGFDVLRLLRRCADEQGCCVVCATHDVRMSEMADRTVHLADGGIGTAHDVLHPRPPGHDGDRVAHALPSGTSDGFSGPEDAMAASTENA